MNWAWIRFKKHDWATLWFLNILSIIMILIYVWRSSLSMILNIFLFFDDFEPGDSYKDYSYKKTVYVILWPWYIIDFYYYLFCVIMFVYFTYCIDGKVHRFFYKNTLNFAEPQIFLTSGCYFSNFPPLPPLKTALNCISGWKLSIRTVKYIPRWIFLEIAKNIELNLSLDIIIKDILIKRKACNGV